MRRRDETPTEALVFESKKSGGECAYLGYPCRVGIISYVSFDEMYYVWLGGGVFQYNSPTPVRTLQVRRLRGTSNPGH